MVCWELHEIIQRNQNNCFDFEEFGFSLRVFTLTGGNFSTRKKKQTKTNIYKKKNPRNVFQYFFLVRRYKIHTWSHPIFLRDPNVWKRENSFFISLKYSSSSSCLVRSDTHPIAFCAVKATYNDITPGWSTKSNSK